MAVDRCPPAVALRRTLAGAAAWVFLVLSVLLFGSGCGGSDDSEPASGSERDVVADSEPESYSGYTIDPPPEVSQVSLPLADGSGEQAMTAGIGGLRLVFFGYTACPDVCPTTMSDLRRALEDMPADERSRVEVAMVTIDPARDVAPGFVDYVTAFVPDGSALRTDDETALRAAADAFGADYEVATTDDGEVEVSHTGELYAVNDAGQVVLHWPFGTDHESLNRDIRSLLAVQGHPETTGSAAER